jgi:hypothetical protein
MKAPAHKTELVDLAVKLRLALGKQTQNIVEIGKLLIKIRESPELAHGKWQGWLKEHFDLSYRTAVNYCSAAEYVARKGKSATVAHLAPTVLYELAAARYSDQEEVVDKGIDFAFVVAADRKGNWPKYKYTYVNHRPAEELYEILKGIAPIVGRRGPFWLLTRDLEPAFIDATDDDDDEDYF